MIRRTSPSGRPSRRWFPVWWRPPGSAMTRCLFPFQHRPHRNAAASECRQQGQGLRALGLAGTQGAQRKAGLDPHRGARTSRRPHPPVFPRCAFGIPPAPSVITVAGQVGQAGGARHRGRCRRRNRRSRPASADRGFPRNTPGRPAAWSSAGCSGRPDGWRADQHAKQTANRRLSDMAASHQVALEFRLAFRHRLGDPAPPRSAGHRSDTFGHSLDLVAEVTA
jgi:hypothetical protein